MSSVTVRDTEYAVSERERTTYDELVSAGVDEVTALQIATGDFDDLQPPAEEWHG